MKKSLLQLVLLCAFVCLLGAQNAGTQAPDNLPSLDSFLVAQSLALTDEMAFLARSREYTGMMTTDSGLEACFDDIGGRDFSKFDAVYFLEQDEKSFDKMIGFMLSSSGGKKAALSPRLRDMLKTKIDNSVFARVLNADANISFLAATTILAAERSWVMPAGWKNSVTVLLVYNDSYSSVTSFSQSGDGVISANSVFILTNASLLKALEKGSDPFGHDVFSVRRASDEFLPAEPGTMNVKKD